MSVSYINKASGVYFTETDLTAYSSGNITIGACVVTPTVKGKAFVPTSVTSYQQFADFFGTTFKSGSDYYEYQGSLLAKEYFNNGGDTLLVVPIKSGSYSPATSTVTSPNTSASFIIETLNDGSILNNSGSEIANSSGSLTLGTVDNIRWEVANSDTSRGTFSLLVRRGDDNAKKPIVLEQFDNLSLDPTSTDYISNKIGDSVYVYDSVNKILNKSGSYPNKSKFIRISSVLQKTPNYFDNAGNVNPLLSGSLPANSSGSFSGGSDGKITHPQAFFENISGSNSQGYDSTTTAYDTAIDLLSNKDDFQFNLLFLSGISAETHPAIFSKALGMVEGRGDALLVGDAVSYGRKDTDAISVASLYDSNYGTLYYNHVQIPSSGLNKNVWVTPSTVVAGVYAYIKKYKQPFYAPAGYNNGSLSSVVTSQVKLSEKQKDALNKGNVNFISKHPAYDYVVLGQNTLQKKQTVLDKNNVRLMLIEAKFNLTVIGNKYIEEQASGKTIISLKNDINAYLEKLIKDYGISAYSTTIDDSPETIDRGEIQIKIELIPIKAIEKIVFNLVLRETGAVLA